MEQFSSVQRALFSLQSKEVRGSLVLDPQLIHVDEGSRMMWVYQASSQKKINVFSTSECTFNIQKIVLRLP